MSLAAKAVTDLGQLGEAARTAKGWITKLDRRTLYNEVRAPINFYLLSPSSWRRTSSRAYLSQSSPPIGSREQAHVSKTPLLGEAKAWLAKQFTKCFPKLKPPADGEECCTGCLGCC